MPRPGLGAFSPFVQRVSDRTQNGGVGDRSVVDRHSFDHSHGVEQAAVLDLLDQFGVFRANRLVLHIAVCDACIRSEATLEFVGDYRCDLLRRP